MKNVYWIVMIAATMISAGCTRLAGPAYERPDIPLLETWSTPTAEEVATLRPDWWNIFEDPELSALVEQALAGNFDLRAAAGRVARAEALAGVAASRRRPILGLSAGATFGQQDTGAGPSVSAENYEAGAGLSWEIDLWGKLKKGQAAADAEVRASGADWRAAYLVVAGQVASQYFRLRQLDKLVLLYERFIATGERINALYQARSEENLISADVVLRQRAELLRLQREAQELQRERRITENGLAALLGRPAGELRIKPAPSRELLRAAPVPAGLPSDLLERRPDVLAAEYRVLAAYNLIGQARLDRLPSIALTGSGGVTSASLGSLLSQWLLVGGPKISIPLFDPAKRRQVEVREAEAEIVSDQYRSTVINAFQEVENALISLENRRSQSEKAAAALADLREAQRINQAQFEEGLISQLQVLESERSLMQSEQVALDLHFRLLNETVTLFKAIGGGWPKDSSGSRLNDDLG